MSFWATLGCAMCVVGAAAWWAAPRGDDDGVERAAIAGLCAAAALGLLAWLIGH